MTRNLLPLTVYLDQADRQRAEERADQMGIATATLLRLILTGQAKPLRLAGRVLPVKR